MLQDVKPTIDEFFGQFNSRTYNKGQVLILSDESTDQIYFLLKGRVKVYDVSTRGDQVVVNNFKPGAFFPLSVAINKQTSPFIYEAETDIEVRQAPSAQVVEFLKANPAVMLDLLGRVYRGADGLMGRLVQLASGSARSRLIYELVIETRRYGSQQADGSWLLSTKEVTLGASAGLSRETVSREFHKLKQEGLLQISSQAITVNSLESLEEKLSTI